MKPSYGMGVLVAILLTIAIALLGFVNFQGAVSMGLLLAGLWTIIAGFAIVESKDRSFYAGWGIIIAGLSLSYFIPIQDALALIILAIIGLIVVTAYYSRAPKPSAQVSPPAVGTPTNQLDP